MRRRVSAQIASLLISLAISTVACAEEPSVMLGAAKSAQLSGLLDYILPIFKSAANLSVHVLMFDPGDAAAIEKHGGANALLLDQGKTTDKILVDRYGLAPRAAIYNDFVIVGPSFDPASIRGMSEAGKAFAAIAAKQALFVSIPGDGSSNELELRLWKIASVHTDNQQWYRKLGPGIQSPLDAAATMNAYALVDRETWANAKNRASLQVLTEHDPALIKVYDSILVSPDKEPLNKNVYARIWHDWLTNKHGNAAISSYKINGEQIFFACQDIGLALCQAALR